MKMEQNMPVNLNLLIVEIHFLPGTVAGPITSSIKGFDLSLFFQFSGGNKIYNGTKASVSDMRYWNNSKDSI